MASNITDGKHRRIPPLGAAQSRVSNWKGDTPGCQPVAVTFRSVYRSAEQAIKRDAPDGVSATEYEMHVTNHLLFVDDLKLVTVKNLNIKPMSEETLRFFEVVSIETNLEKLRQTQSCAEAVLLEGSQGYKYPGD